MFSVLAVVDLAATGVLIGALVVLHLVPTGVSPVTDPVSRYARTRFRAGYTVAALSAAVAGACAALMLGSFPEDRAARTLLLVFAAARLLIPFFPMDEPGTAPSSTCRMHRLLAVLAFGTVTASALTAIGSIAAAGHPVLAALTVACAVVMALGLLGTAASVAGGPVRRVFGLVERLIYLGFMVWFAGLGVAVLAS